MLLHVLVWRRTPSPLGENQRKMSQSHKNGLGAKRVKLEKYEALNKWLLILRSESVLVNRALLKEKASEFANERNIEGFQASEGWLEK